MIVETRLVAALQELLKRMLRILLKRTLRVLLRREAVINAIPFQPLAFQQPNSLGVSSCLPTVYRQAGSGQGEAPDPFQQRSSGFAGTSFQQIISHP